MPGFAYTTEVNKGSVNMQWLTGHLTQMGQQGWRLHTIFEQDKNTVIVYERPHAVAGAGALSRPRLAAAVWLSVTTSGAAPGGVAEPERAGDAADG